MRNRFIGRITLEPIPAVTWTVACLVVCLGVAQAKVSLNTLFVDAVLDRLDIGRSYDVGGLTSQKLLFTNPGDRTLHLVVSVETPPTELRKAGYEAIPDTRWIQITPSRFELKPGETQSVRALLSIPRSPELIGKHYQASVWTHSENDVMSVGVRSQLRFSIQADRPVPGASAVKSSFIEFHPDTLSMDGVDTGKKVALSPDHNGGVVIFNGDSEPVTVRVRSIHFQQDDLPAGYVAAPNPDFLRIVPEELTIPPGSKAPIRIYSEIPSGDAHRSRHYCFLLRADIEGERESTPVFGRIYVKTRN
ncbi:MAG TPA: hypothetical protein PK876_10450 [Elusimicrobiota bacterium]|nr:hypothetical protein [Elusimicrobiota bacterium]